jgi:tetratricopeptide (TPR) repeat protein
MALALASRLAGTSSACLNDRDTSGTVVYALPAVEDVIAGRFDRNPPLYYEMRLARSAEAIESDPGGLDAYDDAAVACDRLGRFDEAIAWMEKKRARLEGLGTSAPDAKEHWYRYHANVGTHWVHRWIKSGADRARLDEVRTARDHIARAVQIKPDAHFGRERFQLMAIEWLIDTPEIAADASELPVYVDLARHAVRPSEVVEGLCGLIVLGNAWESVDTFHALALALDALGESRYARLAILRCEELIDAGRGSFVPGSPHGEALKRLIDRSRAWLPKNGGVEDEVRETFRMRRLDADDRHRQRTDFLLARLQAGRHPDTDPNFWEGSAFAPETIRNEDHDPTSPIVTQTVIPETEEPRPVVVFHVGTLALVVAIGAAMLAAVMAMIPRYRVAAFATKSRKAPASVDPLGD